MASLSRPRDRMTAAPESRLVRVCRLLNTAGVRYVIVGGFALALHGLVRATKDVDVLIEPTLENVRRALRALEGLTFGIAHAEALEDLRRLR